MKQNSTVSNKSTHISQLKYLGIIIQDGICTIGETQSKNYEIETFSYKSFDEIVSYIKRRAFKTECKYVAAGIYGNEASAELGSKLWLELDIVPYLVEETKLTEEETIRHLCKVSVEDFGADLITKLHYGEHREVLPAFLVTLNDYQHTASKEEFDELLRLAKRFEGKTLSFFSATPRGGGVALMRHALIRLYRLLGVDAHWYVMSEKPEVFEVTKKKFHNVLQAVSGPGVKLTDEDKKTYNTWIAENAEGFKEVFASSDVIVIDDPQPSGLVPYIKIANPKAKIMYRSHIQIESTLADNPETIQHITWSFIWNNIKDVDVFIAHPIKGFIPASVPKKDVLFMPATTDPLDGLNKGLDLAQTEYYMDLFDKMLIETGQLPLDHTRKYIIQIARFDPSKGIPDVLASYQELRKKLAKEGHPIPQLIIAGHGAIDDPEGMPIFNHTIDVIHTSVYEDAVNDIKVLRLPHVDQVLDVLLRESEIAMQLSHKEGFEIKVTEALMKGKPVIAYKAGGIPLQIQDTINGFLVPVGNVDEVAEKLYGLLTDKKLYETMSANAARFYRRDVLTLPNAIKWLLLATTLSENGKVDEHIFEKEFAYQYIV